METISMDEYRLLTKPNVRSNVGFAKMRKLVRSVTEDDTINPFNDNTRIPNNARKIPIVLIINGPGRSGKDTFVDTLNNHVKDSNGTVVSCTTVFLVYNAMRELTDLFTDTHTSGYDVRIESSIANKTEEWRQFMHEIKMAWSRYCDGPLRYVVNKAFKSVEDEKCQFITIMSRENDEIMRISQILDNIGFLTIRIYIDGAKTAAQYQNDCDHNAVYDREIYDIYIKNDADYNSFIHKSDRIANTLIQFYNSSDYDYYMYNCYDSNSNLTCD